ncbi:MAG: hypothetical protein AAF481_15105 [Acidobacteriota bacterium]
MEKPITVTVFTDTTTPEQPVQADPSGGWATLKPVLLSEDPIDAGKTKPVSIRFQFNDWEKGDTRTFIGFRWTHSYTEGHLANAHHLGVWYQPENGNQEWQQDDLFSYLSFGPGTMTIEDANPHPYNYVYILEWTEGSGADRKRYVCDPKIRNQSTGGPGGPGDLGRPAEPCK